MKIITILALAFAMQTAALAQSPFSAGIKAGANYSTFTVDNSAAEYGYKPGFHVGAFFEYKPGKLGAMAEASYSRQGATIKANGESLDMDATFVNVPISIRYEIIPTFTVSVGPQVGFLNCIRSDFHPVSQIPYEEQHYTKGYKKTNMGLSVGVGWESSNRLMLDLRYVAGLTDMSDYPGIPETKSTLIQFSVGYKVVKF